MFRSAMGEFVFVVTFLLGVLFVTVALVVAATMIAVPGPGGHPQKGKRVLIEHNGKGLCLPEAALKAHLRHGDAVIDERGCSQ